jgi:hypothetical protein
LIFLRESQVDLRLSFNCLRFVARRNDVRPRPTEPRWDLLQRLPLICNRSGEPEILGSEIIPLVVAPTGAGWQGSDDERVIKARLIMPISGLMDGRAKVDTALSEHGMRVLSRAS